MTPDRIPFGKQIEMIPGHKGGFMAGGKKYENPVKGDRISPDLLDNLRTLAIRAYLSQTDGADSISHSYLDKEMDKMTKKFPEEQPEEVWRRTLATIMQSGASIEEIAGKLLETSPDELKTVWMGESSHQNRDKAIAALSEEITVYWPHPKNSA